MTFELPLFPLNTILFPQMPISLHVFEARYQKMVQWCLDNDAPFGVVLIRRGLEVGGDAEPYKIGCMAHITHTEKLDEGRLNLVAMGKTRFMIKTIYRDKPYLTGVVDELPLIDDIGTPPACPKGEYLTALMAQYLTVLGRVSRVQLGGKMPVEPIPLAYLGATLLQMPAKKNQALLAHNRASELIKAVLDLYRFELPMLTAMMSSMPKIGEEPTPFSLN